LTIFDGIAGKGVYSTYALALGRDEQAREDVATLLRTYSSLTLNQARSMTPFSKEDLVETYLDELRQAGTPD